MTASQNPNKKLKLVRNARSGMFIGTKVTPPKVQEVRFNATTVAAMQAVKQGQYTYADE